MSIEMRTHGLNWKKVLRASELFVALVTEAWHRDPLAQRQYAYAREIHKPIYLLIKAGAALPLHADEHTWKVFTTVDECVELLQQIHDRNL